VTRRIAFARIQQESNCLSPLRHELHDFEGSHYVTGEKLLAACQPGGQEVEGFFKNAELSGFVRACLDRKSEVEPVPILSAWSASGGPLSKSCFETLEARMVEGIERAGKVDGVMLSLHGAMGVDGIADPDTRLLRSAKQAARGAPVAATHDLHANLTRGRVEAADILIAYGTNPHRDHARAGRLAGSLLIKQLLGEIRPTTAWRSLPLILGGGNTIDFLPPMNRVFWKMRWLEARKRCLSASAYMCHPWNSDPGLGWSSHVITDDDQAAAERLADELAEMLWARRHQQPPRFSSASEAIKKARGATLARKTGVVILSDASDVVTAGAAGDSTHLLKAMIDEGQGLLSYAAVRDPAAVEVMWPMPVGAEVALDLGGKLDPASSSPIPVRGTIVHKAERPGFERMVTMAIGDVRVVVTQGPSMVIKPAFYKDAGLPPWKADVVMVKNFFPFLLFFAPMNRKTIFVKTRGTTDFDAAFKLDFDGPVHPRDPVDDWRPRDRQRRGL
jgi:microcystin degradation protein MlrC